MYDIYYGRYRDTDQTVLSKQLLNSIYGRVSMNRDVIYHNHLCRVRTGVVIQLRSRFANDTCG